MDQELCFTPAVELASRIRRGDLSPVRVVEAHLDRIEERNHLTNAFVRVFEERARSAARDAERAVESGEQLGPLHGVPVAIKDLTPVAGQPTTFGSVPLANYESEDDAPAVARLLDAGAIVLGKTNTSEFGHIATTDNELFGATGSPFAPDRTAGGSSGGSAAAVADGLAPIALGSDAGGSIRIPASACGCYGIKPTFGRIPRATRPNAIADALPFTNTGPLTRTVEDAALVFDVIAGTHSSDPFSVPHDGEAREAVGRPVDGLEVIYSTDLSVFQIDDAVRVIVDDGVDILEQLGASVDRDDPALEPIWDDFRNASRTIFQAGMAELVETSEAAFGVDLASHTDELTTSLAAMADYGRDVTAVDLGEANGVRTVVFDAIQDCLAGADLLVTPTLAIPPFDIELHGPDEIDGEQIDPYTGWYLTQPFNMTGHPAASVPAGFTDDGLPVGLQIVGRRHADDVVLAASAALERGNSWTESYPPSE